MTAQLKKLIKIGNKTVPKDSKSTVIAVSNSQYIFKNNRDFDNQGDWFYLMNFPDVGEVAVLISEAQIV